MRAVEVLRSALMSMVEEMGLSWPVKAVIEPPRDARHGDLAVNVAMLLAKEAGKNPRELAQTFAAGLPERLSSGALLQILNVFLTYDQWRKLVKDVLEEDGV